MRRISQIAAAGLVVASALLTLSTAQAAGANGKGGGTVLNHDNNASIGGNIKYHGGPVIQGAVNVYLIWYGNWAGNTAVAITEDLVRGLGGSPYMGINTTYGGNPGRVRCSNAYNLSGEYTDSYSQGSNLSDTGVFNVVNSAITGGHLPKDTNAVYFVLTSEDVNETGGFCTSYCGWHTYGTVSGSTVQYSFVGNPARCLSSCAWQSTISPNNNPGADGMASILAHELEEAQTDPTLTAWFDNIGQENADKCAWTFGTTYDPGNGSVANMKLGARDYLIQQNWSKPQGLTQACALGYTGP